jgi:C4-dicarboxylate transporter DctM subunit
MTSVLPSPDTAPAPHRLFRFLHRVEDAVLVGLLLAMAFIPVIDMAGRAWFDFGIKGGSDYLQHLTLWIGFLGAMLTTRMRSHLKIATAVTLLPVRGRRAVEVAVSFACACVCAGLFGASLQLVIAEAPALPAAAARFIPGFIKSWLEWSLFEGGSQQLVAGVAPIWVAEAAMPFGFAVMAVRFILQSSRRPAVRGLVALSLPFTALLAMYGSSQAAQWVAPGLVALVAATLCGAPIFILLGGAALMLFWGEGVTVAAIPTESYRIVASPIFPTIPLFTLAGFILSEGHASERLVALFRSWFGWIPGGLAVAATLLCAFFTTFTGASGVTILALGGLLLPVLLTSGFNEKFSVGLITATGSIGLLLPPSLVVILYGVIAHVPITDMFLAGLVPGNLMVLPICALCYWHGRRSGAGRAPFVWRTALCALWVAKWEVAMPVLVLVLLFGGFCTLIQTAALLVVYALFVETVIYRDQSFSEIFAMLRRCVVMVGAVLIILGVAMGLTSYLVDAQVPLRAAEWAESRVHAQWVFLLALNGALLLVGCLMDIYSALVVVVPIILPMAAQFGVDPVHLGIIFLANLQLGYLTPPVGMNLFLASLRFDRPLAKVSRYALPFLGIMAVVVLLITFVPWFSVGVMRLLK